MPAPAEFDRAIDELEAAGPERLAQVLRAFLALARDRYRREEAWLAALPAPMGAKLTAQHAEILEIGDALAQSLDRAHAGDIRYLVRRLVALARHNLIEKERDVIPYYDQKI